MAALGFCLFCRCRLVRKSYVLTLAVVSVGFLFANRVSDVAAKPSNGKQTGTSKPNKTTPMPRIQKEELRYEGKSFEDWRNLLLTELQPKRKVQALQVIIVFSQQGFATEAMTALLEMARGYEPILALEEADCPIFSVEEANNGNDQSSPRSILEAASKAVKWIGPSAIPILREGLKDESRAVRLFAIITLGELKKGNSDAITDLLKILRGGDTVQRLAVLRALGQIETEDKRLSPALTTALKDKSEDVRITALDALETHGGEIARSAVPGIVDALKDTNPRVREHALKALRSAGLRASFVPQLLEVMKDKDAEVQHQAYLCLRVLGPKAKDAVPILLVRLKQLRAANGSKSERTIRGQPLNLPVPSGSPLHGATFFESVAFDELSEVIVALGSIGKEARQSAPVLKELLPKADDAHQRLIREALQHMDEGKPGTDSTGSAR
jgi:HEAT repeats